ncbi:MAG: amidase [Pseudomonadota bacterium]|nr:amidase [Pseudomonadota bacterium]
MDRRIFLATAAALASPKIALAENPTLNATSGRRAKAGLAGQPGFADELTLADIEAAFAEGRLTSRRLTQLYLDRIEAIDRRGPTLHAVLELNPRALDMAAELDRERRAQGPRGPLHGVPIMIKDNVETADRMMTTAGSLALEGWYAPQDAPLVARLRAAGAVIMGKTNLSEWANFRSTHSSSGWSGRGGQTRNPYALDRSPSGSSSGSAVAVAANLCALAVGSETNGSIVSPASINGIVGLKPTVGLVSRTGIVPISHSQDTAGPLARTVRDAAVLLGVMAGPDPADPASVAVGDRFDPDYVRYLDPQGLRGARLGIARRFFADNAPLDRFLDHCIAILEGAGAVIVDPADLPMHGVAEAAELEVLLYEFKADLNAYLTRLPTDSAVRSLEDLIRFNEANSAVELASFDQELLRRANTKGGLDEAAYKEARATCLNATRAGGIDAVLAEHRLDAIVTLTSGMAWLIDALNGDSDVGSCSSPAAIAGYPHISVPAGLHRGLPVGLSFFGTAFSEPTLLRLASGFEHVAKGRTAPRFLAGD